METDQWFFEKNNAKCVRLLKNSHYNFSKQIDVIDICKEAEAFLTEKTLLYDPDRAAKKLSATLNLDDIRDTPTAPNSAAPTKRRSSERIRKEEADKVTRLQRKQLEELLEDDEETWETKEDQEVAPNKRSRKPRKKTTPKSTRKSKADDSSSKSDTVSSVAGRSELDSKGSNVPDDFTDSSSINHRDIDRPVLS